MNLVMVYLDHMNQVLLFIMIVKVMLLIHLVLWITIGRINKGQVLFQCSKLSLWKVRGEIMVYETNNIYNFSLDFIGNCY